MGDELSPNQIKQMINMLKQMLPEETNDTAPEVEVNKDESPIRTVNKKPKQTTNKFDEMMEAHLHKADTEIDKKLAKYGPTPRLRKFTPLKVSCRVCGKKEEVNPNVLTDTPERYKCNDCSRRAG